MHVQMGGAPRAHDAVQRWVQGVQQEIAGRVVLRGCPWEEGGRRRRGAAQMMWGLKRPPPAGTGSCNEIQKCRPGERVGRRSGASEWRFADSKLETWSRFRIGGGRRTSYPEMAIVTASHFTGKRGKTDAY